MAIKKLNYLGMPRKVREASGATALSELRRMLNVPGISPEQRGEIEARIQRVTAWIKGTLPSEQLPAAKAAPKVQTRTIQGQHHTVIVSEQLNIDEKVS